MVIIFSSLQKREALVAGVYIVHKIRLMNFDLMFQQYLSEHANGTAVTDDLWDALKEVHILL